MRKLIDWILLVAVVLGIGYAAYTHQTQVRTLAALVLPAPAPCSQPLTYSVVSIDPRFGIATSTLVADLQEAANIWQQASDKNLLQYEPSGGTVSVSLVYDERQAASDQLASLGISIDESKATYDSLQARYDALKATIDSEQTQYNAQVAAYHQNENSYNAEVSKWNNEGGAPPAEYAKLNDEKAALASEFASIKSLEGPLNSNIGTLNALATTINQLIVQLNLNVQQYNGSGEAGGEFEEGQYENDNGVQTIQIYEFESHVQLVRVLAHEMGHSLGLQHVTDPEAIMYKINAGTSLTATAADIAELDSVCHFSPAQ